MIYGNDSTELEIILSNLDCRGNEPSLFDCQVNVHNRVTQECDHTELAGVRCGGKLTFLMEFPIKLLDATLYCCDRYMPG